MGTTMMLSDNETTKWDKYAFAGAVVLVLLGVVIETGSLLAAMLILVVAVGSVLYGMFLARQMYGKMFSELLVGVANAAKESREEDEVVPPSNLRH